MIYRLKYVATTDEPVRHALFANTQAGVSIAVPLRELTLAMHEALNTDNPNLTVEVTVLQVEDHAKVIAVHYKEN